MRTCKRFLLLVLSCLFSLTVFSGVSINASAADEYVQMDFIAGRSFFGDSIPFTYYFDDVPFSGTFEFLTSDLFCNGLNIAPNDIIPSPSVVDSYNILLYRAELSNVPYTYIDVDIPLDMEFSGSARGFFALTFSNFGMSIPENQISLHPDNYLGSFSALSANYGADSSLSDYYNSLTLRSGSNTYLFRAFPYNFSGGMSFTSLHGQSCRTAERGYFYLAIGLPYFTGHLSTISPGETTAPPSGGGDVNVTVDVDMSETNGLLGTLIDAVKGIGDFIIEGLKGLFVPKDGAIDNFHNTILNLFYEVFSPYKETQGLLDSLRDDLMSNSAMETVTFPQISVPGTKFQIGPYQVPLKPNASGMADFYANLRMMLNVLATIAVVNMLINKVKAILVGEQVVEVEEIDDY